MRDSLRNDVLSAFFSFGVREGIGVCFGQMLLSVCYSCNLMLSCPLEGHLLHLFTKRILMHGLNALHALPVVAVPGPSELLHL